MNDHAEHNWLTELAKKRRHLNLAPIEQACALHTDEELRKMGQQMADALIKLKCDEDTLCAALLYPAHLAKKISDEKIIKILGKPVLKLINGTERMAAIDHIAIHDVDHGELKIDNLRKLFLAMVDDIRVVLIKLAERLSALKQIKTGTHEAQKMLATQVMHIYGPLANRLGVGQLKWRLEDLAFRYLEPEAYRPIAKQLKVSQEDREKFVAQMIRKLENLVKLQHFEKFSITGRAKHIYSIHQKLHRKGGDFKKLYDTSAFRILVPTVEDCYTVLGIVHATWKPISTEFDDYIAKPKPNGYQSIHTAITDQNGINVEIQIRTYHMHEISELGIAAHWKYKEGGSPSSSYEDKINWLRKVIDWQKELSQNPDSPEEIFQKIFEDRIYVFTPNGDIFDLENGSTPIDFAYHLHTDVGHRCKGAKVNGILLPLTHQLNTGDRVEILTAKESKPSRDWMNPNLHYLKTRVALSKVRAFFAKMDREKTPSAGINFPDKELHKTLIMKRRVYAAEKAEESEKKATPELDLLGASKLLTKIAKCCHPTPSHEILGYITKSRGISIHEKSCANIQNSAKDHPERIIEINWKI